MPPVELPKNYRALTKARLLEFATENFGDAWKVNLENTKPEILAELERLVRASKAEAKNETAAAAGTKPAEIEVVDAESEPDVEDLPAQPPPEKTPDMEVDEAAETLEEPVHASETIRWLYNPVSKTVTRATPVLRSRRDLVAISEAQAERFLKKHGLTPRK